MRSTCNINLLQGYSTQKYNNNFINTRFTLNSWHILMRNGETTETRTFEPCVRKKRKAPTFSLVPLSLIGINRLYFLDIRSRNEACITIGQLNFRPTRHIVSNGNLGTGMPLLRTVHHGKSKSCSRPEPLPAYRAMPIRHAKRYSNCRL